MIDEKLKEYATDRQAQIIDTVNKNNGNKRAAGRTLGVDETTVRDALKAVNRKAAHLGHLHSRHVVESNLMIVEQHRTIAAPDAYASRGGWCSGRESNTITYHKQFGEVGRTITTEAMLR